MSHTEEFPQLASRVIGALMHPANIRAVEDRYNTSIQSLANSVIEWVECQVVGSHIEVSDDLSPQADDPYTITNAQLDECRSMLRDQDKLIEDLQYTLRQKNDDISRLQRKLDDISESVKEVSNAVSRIKR